MYRPIKKHLAFAISGILLSCTVFQIGCGKKNTENKSDAVEMIEIPVTVCAVVRGTIQDYLSFNGNIDAWNRAAIAPAMPGKILKIYVEEGQKVSAGQVLVKMDDKQTVQAEARYTTAKADYGRMKALLDNGSITPQQFEQVESGFTAAKAGWEMARQSSVLEAPFSGTIIGKYFNNEEIFSSMKPTPDGSGVIVSLAQLDVMKIEVNVPERDFPKIQKGQKVYIEIQAYPDRVFEGVVALVNPSLDMRSRSAKVKVEIKNPDRTLKPGMFANVKIKIAEKNKVLIVPASSVVQRNGAPAVYCVAKGTPPYSAVAIFRKVSTGIVTPEFAEITNGISEGELVTFEGNASLEEGTKVRVIESGK